MSIYNLKLQLAKKRAAQKDKLHRNPHIRFTSHFDYSRSVDFLNHYPFFCSATEITAIHVAPGKIPSIT